MNLRATGTKVLLRRVKSAASFLFYEDRTPGVLQVGEIISLGPRWTADVIWRPPMPGATERPKGVVWTHGHEAILQEVKEGDLVVFNMARVLDHFCHEGADILVYPGNWILGVLDKTCIPPKPHRFYERHTV
jgi:hypothetical protein